MSFWKTLSEKLGFMSGESDERDEDELEDGEIQDEDYDDEEENESQSSFRFSLNNPFNKNKKQTSSSRRNAGRRDEEEDEDDEDDEEEAPRQARSSGRRSNVIHDFRMDPRAAQEIQYTHCERIVNVRQIEECREIIKYLLKGALQGRMLKVAHLSYLLAPENVEVIEEDVYAASRMRYR